MNQLVYFLLALDLTGIALGLVLGWDKTKTLISSLRPKAGLVWDMAVFALVFLAAGGVD